MRVLALDVDGVRNLERLVLEPAPRFNVFHGQNGQGKTNLLEAIYVVAALRSFRTSKLADLIRFGAPFARLGARVDRGGLERVYELTIEPHGRKVRLDGKTARPLARYFGAFNVVLFAPEDLGLPRGAPADRRRFLDRAVFNRRAEYMPLAQDYEKVLRSRNALLRDEAPQDLVSVYDEQLASLASQIAGARLAYVDELRTGFQTAFDAISRSGRAVDISYRTEPDISVEAYRRRLAGNIAIDRARGSTSVGPHRDDLAFVFEGHDAGSFASQGQLRALVLAWKTAEMGLLAQVHGEEPILLLDDVSSELDQSRNEFLFDFLSRRTSQCFITTTHPDYVLVREERVDFEVREGRIR